PGIKKQLPPKRNARWRRGVVVRCGRRAVGTSIGGFHLFESAFGAGRRRNAQARDGRNKGGADPKRTSAFEQEPPQSSNMMCVIFCDVCKSDLKRVGQLRSSAA